jgi:hypothetical protein
MGYGYASRRIVGHFGEMIDVGFLRFAFTPLCAVALRCKMPSPAYQQDISH